MTQNRRGNVEMRHHSTASLVEIITYDETQDVQGGVFKVEETNIWLDYSQWEDLKHLVNTVAQP